MFKYLFLLCVYIPFYLLAMLLAPVLPLFAELRNGPIDNNSGYGVEPRLPTWLSWFDTSYDNSLWGDNGWRTKHCTTYWQSYIGMVLWLWRNPAAGFCWKVLAVPIYTDTTFTLTDSGNGVNVDKGHGTFGWFRITSSSGYFQYRVVKRLLGDKAWTFDCGWLLDLYLKSPDAKLAQPRALFQFQPQVRTVKVP
jgi:hypothetical protein